MPVYRSRTSTHGRNMAGARGLWRATGMKDGDFVQMTMGVYKSWTNKTIYFLNRCIIMI